MYRADNMGEIEMSQQMVVLMGLGIVEGKGGDIRKRPRNVAKQY